MTTDTQTVRPQVPDSTTVEFNKPAFRGLDLLIREMSQHVQVPTARKDIDWRTVTWEQFGWRPHDKQEQVMDAIFEQKKKVIIVRASKRGGKTNVATTAAKTLHEVKADARGWVASKTYDLADRVYDGLWPALTSGQFGEVQDKSRKDRRVRLVGGGLAQAKSWDDPDSLEGESLDYCICDEAQTLDQLRLDLILARTLDRGGFVLLIGSPSINDMFFLGLCDAASQGLNPDWAYIEWDVYENPYLGADEIETLKGSMSEEAFLEYFLLQTRLPQGLVFGEVYSPEENRFESEPDRGFPMEVWVDPGTTMGAYAVLFVQCKEGPIPEVRVYDLLYEHNTYTEKVVQLARRHRYWPLVRSGIIDVAGRAKHDKATSPKDLWIRMARIPMYDQKVGIMEGIDRQKTFWYQATTGLRRLKIHNRCADIHKELLHWRFPTRGPAVGVARRPIDAFNHALKAISYGLVHHFGYFDKNPRNKKRSRYIDD